MVTKIEMEEAEEKKWGGMKKRKEKNKWKKKMWQKDLEKKKYDEWIYSWKKEILKKTYAPPPPPTLPPSSPHTQKNKKKKKSTRAGLQKRRTNIKSREQIARWRQMWRTTNVGAGTEQLTNRGNGCRVKLRVVDGEIKRETRIYTDVRRSVFSVFDGDVMMFFMRC